MSGLEARREGFSLHNPDKNALALLNASSAEKLCAVPFAFDESGKLLVAMREANDMSAVEEIRMLTGHRIVVKTADAGEICRAISDFYKVAHSVGEAMQDHAGHASGPFAHLSSEEPERLNAPSPDDAPVVKLLNNILERSVAERASDVHIEPGEETTSVRFRIDGRLFELFSIPAALHQALLARVKIKARMDIAEKRRPQDGRILAVKESGRIDIRVSTVPTVYGEKAVLRILDQGLMKPDTASLGFSTEQQAQLEAMLRHDHGICLVTGPTGSGKSTTLFALLRQLDHRSVNIVTVEDPVEYTVEGVTQIQVNEKIDLGFSSLLRSVLRQDPDVIMVGEIRDAETAQLAVRAALTGHLVLATLHTNDAPSAPGRLLDMGVPGFLLASSLNGVVAQRLVRLLCPDCRATGADAAKTAGCPRCRGTGYAGRTVVAEIMTADETIREMISAAAPAHQIRTYARQKGMCGLFENAMQKVSQGIVDRNEVYALEKM